jgi:hypothetical protein
MLADVVDPLELTDEQATSEPSPERSGCPKTGGASKLAKKHPPTGRRRETRIRRPLSKIVMAAKRPALPRYAPSGIRTRATTLKGWRPRPLVDGGGRPRIAATRVYTGRWGPVAQLVEQGTFNPKVTGSIPVRPIREVPANLGLSSQPLAASQCVPVRVSVRLISDRERVFHLRCLELALGALPVAVDVRCGPHPSRRSRARPATRLLPRTERGCGH